MSMTIPSPDPIITAKRPYTEDMLANIYKVFGDKGHNLAKEIECNITIKGPSRTVCNFTKREVTTIMNHKDWLHVMPAVIHEFAHHYTNHFFMGYAVNAPAANHEATAMVAELMLMTVAPEHGAAVRTRIKTVRNHPMPAYRQAMELIDKHMDEMRDEPMHNVMLRLINDYS